MMCQAPTGGDARGNGGRPPDPCPHQGPTRYPHGPRRASPGRRPPRRTPSRAGQPPIASLRPTPSLRSRLPAVRPPCGRRLHGCCVSSCRSSGRCWHAGPTPGAVAPQDDDPGQRRGTRTAGQGQPARSRSPPRGKDARSVPAPPRPGSADHGCSPPTPPARAGPWWTGSSPCPKPGPPTATAAGRRSCTPTKATTTTICANGSPSGVSATASPQRDRVRPAARPPPMGCGEDRVLARRLPAASPPLRTQGRTCPRLRRHSRSPHVSRPARPCGRAAPVSVKFRHCRPRHRMASSPARYLRLGLGQL